MEEQIQNGREINLHMNKKTKWLSKCKLIFFFCGSELLNLLILYDLGVKTNISDVYCSSSDLYFIAKAKMNVILDIYYQNNDVILNTKVSPHKFIRSYHYTV